MLHEEALEIVKSTAQKPVFRTALTYLKAGTELALLLDDRVEFALFLKNKEVCVEERQAKADVEFSFSAEALRLLSGHPGEQLASFGIAICEQVLAGQMKIRVRGSLLRVLTGGYLQMILAAGPELLQFLAMHGISNASRILDLIRSLKK